MSTPVKKSRLGPGVDTSASPLPLPGSAESKLWEPDWLVAGDDMWNREKTRGSVSDISPLTPTRSNSGFGAQMLMREGKSISEESSKQTPTKKIDMSPSQAFGVSTPPQGDTTSSPLTGKNTDAADLIFKSQKKRRGAVDIKSPIVESPVAAKAEKRGVGKHMAGEENSAGSGSNSTTPRQHQRKPHKAPRPQVQTDISQNPSHASHFQGANVPERAQPAQHAPYSGTDAALYAQFLSSRNLVNQFTSVPSGHSPQPHIPSTTPGYSSFYSASSVAHSQAPHQASPAANFRGTASAAMSGYPEYSNSGPSHGQGGYGNQAGAFDPFSAPFGNQIWAPTPMGPSSPYNPAASMQMTQEQGAQHGYGFPGNALVPAGDFGYGMGGQSMPQVPIVPSQALAPFQPDAFNQNPFVDNTASAPPSSEGVVKIGNIPYSATKQDVWSALGKTAKVVVDCPIHIIMERSTAKTMDCYIEFLSVHDARAMIKKFDRMQEDGRPAKIGLRAVEYELSTQRELQKSLFPRAKCVDWSDGSPKILPCTDPYSTGFQGFVTREEMHQLVRHAEVPARAPYSSKCPQRPYECMISTLYKFPWHATEHYTNGDRFLMFKSTHSMTKALCNQLKKTDRMDNIDESLLRELLVAAMKTPGIAEREKVILAKVVFQEGIHINLPQDLHEIYRVSAYANEWPFEVLGRKKEGVSDQILEFYFQLLACGNYFKNGATDLPAQLPRLRCYVNHDDPNQNGRTMAKEIELETELLFSIITEYSNNQATDNHRQIGYVGPQSEEDERFNAGMQALKRQTDMLMASSDQNHAASELLAQRAQVGGFRLPSSPFVPGMQSPYMPNYINPMMPPPGPQGQPQTFNSPFDQPAFPGPQQGFGYPPSSRGSGQGQGRLYDPYAQDPSQKGPQSRR